MLEHGATSVSLQFRERQFCTRTTHRYSRFCDDSCKISSPPPLTFAFSIRDAPLLDACSIRDSSLASARRKLPRYRSSGLRRQDGVSRSALTIRSPCHSRQGKARGCSWGSAIEGGGGKGQAGCGRETRGTILSLRRSHSPYSPLIPFAVAASGAAGPFSGYWTT